MVGVLILVDVQVDLASVGGAVVTSSLVSFVLSVPVFSPRASGTSRIDGSSIGGLSRGGGQKTYWMSLMSSEGG